jgi:hypothetical protein
MCGSNVTVRGPTGPVVEGGGAVTSDSGKLEHVIDKVQDGPGAGG